MRATEHLAFVLISLLCEINVLDFFNIDDIYFFSSNFCYFVKY